MLTISSGLVSAKPGPDNTGPTVSESDLEAYSGPTTISTAGTVIEGVVIDRSLTISASNVTIRNFIIRTDGYYGVQINSGATGTLIEDGIIENMKSAAILGSNFTARRLEIRNSGADGIKPGSNYVIEDSWIHHLGYIPSSHADGIQVVAGNNGVIRGNNFDMPSGLDGYRNSQCMIIQTNNGGINNVLIEGNWINGGGYSVQIRDKGNGHGAPTNVRILNNRFGTDYNFGIWRIDGSAVTDGNVWDATGLPVSNQSGGGGSTEPVDPPIAQAQVPTVSPVGAVYLVQQEVSLSTSTSGAVIHYTTDGSTPTASSSVYNQPITISETSVLQAIAVADGMEDSYIAREEYLFDGFASIDEWLGAEFADETGEMAIVVEFVPSSTSVDSVVGLSLGAAGGYTDLAAIFRFSPEGVIDARNGSAYQSHTELRYEAGVTYKVAMQVDIPERTYSVSVVVGDGMPVKIAKDYAFRTEQANISALDHVSFRSIGQENLVSSVRFVATPEPPDPDPM